MNLKRRERREGAGREKKGREQKTGHDTSTAVRLGTHMTVWFRQHGATSHTARMSTEKLREMFPYRVPNVTVSRFKLAAKIS
jgi:hypothetical protein